MAWSGIRFPNPGADIPRMLTSVRVVYGSMDFGQSFDMDHIVEQLATNHLAGSSGAAGAAAVRRSFNKDRSRDRLFNQAKMYSELWRMLGFIHPTEARREFTFTPFARSLIEDAAGARECEWGLVREALLGITFPNPNVRQLGVASHRPFAWALQLLSRLDGWMNRDEFIVGVLALQDDRAPSALDETIELIRMCRKNRSAPARVAALARAANVQANTLSNYTRFPQAVLRDPSIGWGVCESIATPYKKSDPVTRLLPAGEVAAVAVGHMQDIRVADLATLGDDARAGLALFAHYLSLQRAGFGDAGLEEALLEAEGLASPALASLGITDARGILFGPWQQLDRSTLDAAAKLVSV